MCERLIDHLDPLLSQPELDALGWADLPDPTPAADAKQGADAPRSRNDRAAPAGKGEVLYRLLDGNLARGNAEGIGDALAVCGIGLQAVADMADLNLARHDFHGTRGVLE